MDISSLVNKRLPIIRLHDLGVLRSSFLQVTRSEQIVALILQASRDVDLLGDALLVRHGDPLRTTGATCGAALDELCPPALRHRSRANCGRLPSTEPLSIGAWRTFSPLRSEGNMMMPKPRLYNELAE